MQYRNVGGSGLKVSEIALGSWMTRLEDAAAVDIAMDIAHKASRRRGDFIEGVFQNRQFGQWRWSESQTYSQ